MPINSLAVATSFRTALDKAILHDMLTGWMDANASDAIYEGGKYIKIPQMSVSGMGDYDRDNGYVQGAVTLSYVQYEMTQDRGRKFQLDAMDVTENNFVTTAGAVMGEFQRTKVVPEVDAYRLSKVASLAITKNASGMIEYGYTAGSTGTSALRKFKEGIKAVRESGYSGQLVAHVTPTFKLELELELAGKLTSVAWSQGGISTVVPAVDGVALIETPQNRMYTAITTLDGTTTSPTSQVAGGYTKGTTAKDVNFMILPIEAPIAVTKQDKMRIFTPETYQKADAWAMDYRRFHDLWVLDNMAGTMFINIKDAQ